VLRQRAQLLLDDAEPTGKLGIVHAAIVLARETCTPERAGPSLQRNPEQPISPISATDDSLVCTLMQPCAMLHAGSIPA
jgi:hypothetical protein